MKIATLLIILCYFRNNAYAWDDVEMEIFDLVEEINENFYQSLGVKQDSSLAEIKKAFRNLSVLMHPDKTTDPDANVKFRNLVSIYEVLKDSSKRQKYDDVLKNGLPDWKSALYYYRRVRKMGLLEMSIILFVILTIGQYLIAWAVYAEKKYTAETLLGSKLKRMQKKSKSTVDMDVLLSGIPSPSIFNTLPFQIPRTIWNIPKNIKGLYDLYIVYKQERDELLEQEARELEKQQRLEEEFAREKELKKEGIRRRKEKFAVKEKTDDELKGYSKLNLENIAKGSVKAVVNKPEPIISGGFWTDEDLNELIRLVKKYPSGSASRWDTIAESMNRSVYEVTFMAAKMKENGYRIPGHTDSVAETIVQEAAKKVKVKKVENQIMVPESNWTQEQQQLLELAIVKYPKSGASDRWQKISNNVPGKTKEECLARYRHLVEVVKAQKLKSQELTTEQMSNPSSESIMKDDIHESTPICEKSFEQNVCEMDTATRIENNKGKPRNKRKERKQRIELSGEYDDDDDDDDDDEDGEDNY